MYVLACLGFGLRGGQDLYCLDRDDDGDDLMLSLSIDLASHGISRASDVVTDVMDSKVIRLSRNTDSQPFLELPFPCKVLDETVTCKFKSKTRTLVVSAQPDEDACVGLGQTKEDEDGADVALMREFGDEAYLASLSLNSSTERPSLSPPSGRTQDGLPTPSCSAASSIPAAAAAPSTAAQGTEASSSSKSESTGIPAAASRLARIEERSAAASAAPDDTVAAAFAVDGTGLAAAMGHVFLTAGPATPAAATAPKGNRKKVKKEKKSSSSLMSSATVDKVVKLVADSLHTRGYAACGEPGGFSCADLDHNI